MTKYNASILVGPPGVGKYAVGRLIVERGPSNIGKEFFYLNAGRLLRHVAQHFEEIGDIENDIGQVVRKYMRKGRKPPTDVVMEVLGRTLYYLDYNGHFKPHEQDLVIGGIPRSLDQVAPFNDIVDVDTIFYLNASKRTLERRVRGRWETERRPEDRSDKAFEARYKLFWNKTYPILREYPGRVVRLSSNDKGFLADRILEHFKQKLIKVAE